MARQLMFSIRHVGRKGTEGNRWTGKPKPKAKPSPPAPAHHHQHHQHQTGQGRQRSCARTCTRAYTRLYAHTRARAQCARIRTHAPAHAHVRTHAHARTGAWGRARSIELTRPAENVTPLNIPTLKPNATEHIARNEPRMPQDRRKHPDAGNVSPRTESTLSGHPRAILVSRLLDGAAGLKGKAETTPPPTDADGKVPILAGRVLRVMSPPEVGTLIHPDASAPAKDEPEQDAEESDQMCHTYLQMERGSPVLHETPKRD